MWHTRLWKSFFKSYHKSGFGFFLSKQVGKGEVLGLALGRIYQDSPEDTMMGLESCLIL